MSTRTAGTSQPHDNEAEPSLAITASNTQIADLLEHLREIADISAVSALASWDQNTAMPEGASAVRGDQMGTLTGVLHNRWTNPQLGTVLGALESEVAGARFTDADRGLVREARRTYDQYTKLPYGLVCEKARVESAAFDAWHTARAQSDFELFAPWLGRIITLDREIADRLGYTGARYNALLDQYEPGMTVARLDDLFGPVRDISIALLRRIEASGHTVETSFMQGEFPASAQMDLSEGLLRHMGYDFSRGALSRSPHPFTTGFGSPFDVRLTVNPDEHRLQASLMAALHEGGHAVYEQGFTPEHARSPLANAPSLGAHESQSRLWENAIGRSEAFWHSQYTRVREAFPRQLGHVEDTAFARALNRVRPSLIRIEADEVTYNLHIIIRYEMEKLIVDGDVAIESLPRLWNEKYRQYLGIEPANDGEGILQDVHWTSGFGYFPTYTLGNLYGAQIYATLRREFPDWDDRLAAGDTTFVLAWLRDHMYRFGATYLTADLMRKVTGEAPDAAYFAHYLTRKTEVTYDLPPSA